jgi:hypothetical protein
MNQSSDQDLWTQMLIESAPIVDHRTTQILYHRAAAAWAYGQTLQIADGLGGWVDLTKLFEQYRMLQILKGEKDGNSKDSE